MPQVGNGSGVLLITDGSNDFAANMFMSYCRCVEKIQKLQKPFLFMRHHMSMRVLLVALLLVSFGGYIIIFMPRTLAFTYGVKRAWRN